MSTITRLMTIIIQQDGYILSSEDMLAVSRMCGGISATLFAVFVFLFVIRYRKQKA